MAVVGDTGLAGTAVSQWLAGDPVEVVESCIGLPEVVAGVHIQSLMDEGLDCEIPAKRLR